MWKRVFVGALVLGLLAAGTYLSLEYRESSERDLAAEPLLAPLPYDAETAGHALALRLAGRLCEEPSIEKFTVSDDEGTQTGHTYVPSCLGDAETADVVVSVTSLDPPDGLVLLADRDGPGCIATPTESDRVLVRHFRGEGGFRCPSPGCRCPVASILGDI